jgi:hypothetical protein
MQRERVTDQLACCLQRVRVSGKWGRRWRELMPTIQGYGQVYLRLGEIEA